MELPRLELPLLETPDDFMLNAPDAQSRGTVCPDAYCYRCPFGLNYPDCNLQCAEYIDYMIKEEGNVAAVLVEPVVGTNGRIVRP